MKPQAVHWIGHGSLRHDGVTACGLIAHERIAPGEYRAYDCNKPIKAQFQNWEGVTCKRCLRNPHAKKDV